MQVDATGFGISRRQATLTGARLSQQVAGNTEGRAPGSPISVGGFSEVCAPSPWSVCSVPWLGSRQPVTQSWPRPSLPAEAPALVSLLPPLWVQPCHPRSGNFGAGRGPTPVPLLASPAASVHPPTGIPAAWPAGPSLSQCPSAGGREHSGPSPVSARLQ